MTRLRLLWLVVMCFPLGVMAQPHLGEWNGYLEVPGSALRIQIDLRMDGDSLTGLMRSLDQGGVPASLSVLSLENRRLYFEVDRIGVSYEGHYDATSQTITGEFTQMGLKFELNFSRESLDAIRPDRPQTPQPPFPYTEKEVRFTSSDPRYQLSGTLTMPDGTAKAGVVLVSGSGPQDRDSFIFNHRPFLVWADYLARNGIAVLRFDERGIAQSEGVRDACTTYDLANDVQKAHTELTGHLKANAASGIIGLSEGGLIAAILASQDKSVDFIVSLAGPGVTGPEILYTQTIDIAMASGMNREEAAQLADRNRLLHEVVLQENDSASTAKLLRERLSAFSEADEEPFDEGLFQQYNAGLNTPWMRSFLTIDPRQYWSKVDCAVLALNGSRDLQVAAGPNLRAIGFALRRNKNSQFTTQVLEDHNHLFQRSSTGAITEYGQLTETITEETLLLVTEWINAQKRP